ncbi:MAG: hypothetical protein JSU09_07315 [Bacteroidetes bacterium]|nr:hypothetical protein [Bacteroidota bacterium]
MIKILFGIILAFFIASQVFCQDRPKNGAFIEIGGSSILYSLNFERSFTKGINGRIGVSFFDNTFSSPVLIGKVFGKSNHHFELDGGFLYANSRFTDSQFISQRRNTFFVTGFVGYRYQRPDGKFFFRSGGTFLWFVWGEDSKDRSWNFMPWPSIGCGYLF